MSELINTLPQIVDVSVADNEATIELYISKELDYFKGHFPNAPVLPGVAQLDWAVHFAQLHLAIEPVSVKNVEVLKFQVVIQPELTVKLVLTKKSANKFTFKYTSAKGTHASGRLVLKEV